MLRLLILLALAAPAAAQDIQIYVPPGIDPTDNPFTACPYRLAREYYRTSRSVGELSEYIGRRCAELEHRLAPNCPANRSSCDRRDGHVDFAAIGRVYVERLRRAEAGPRKSPVPLR